MLTPAQAAEYLGVHVRTLRRYIRDGRLQRSAILPSGHARYSRADLEALLKDAS